MTLRVSIMDEIRTPLPPALARQTIIIPTRQLTHHGPIRYDPAH